MDINMNEIQEKIDQAIIELSASTIWAGLMPFIVAIELEYTSAVPYAGVTGLKMFINPETCKDLSVPQMKFLLLHEVMHIAAKHEYLYKDEFELNPMIINAACDFWINWEVMKLDSTRYDPKKNDIDLTIRGELEFIKGGLLDKKYSDWNVMQIYHDLLQQSKDKGKGYSNNAPTSGCISQDNSSMGNVADTENIAKIDSILAGCEANNLTQQLKATPSSVVPWRKLLKLAWLGVGKSQNSVGTWQRPNKKLMSSVGVYYPSRQKTETQKVLVAIDTSGSITPEQAQAFLAECLKLHNITKNGVVCSFSSEVVQQWDLSKGAIPSLVYAGGGTAITPVFDLAEKIDARLVVVMSDMDFYDTVPKHKQDVAWVYTDSEPTNLRGVKIKL